MFFLHGDIMNIKNHYANLEFHLGFSLNSQQMDNPMECLVIGVPNTTKIDFKKIHDNKGLSRALDLGSLLFLLHITTSICHSNTMSIRINEIHSIFFLQIKTNPSNQMDNIIYLESRNPQAKDKNSCGYMCLYVCINKT